MNEEQINWAKTTILSYKHLGTICGAIDKLVETVATRSFYSSTRLMEYNSIHNVSRKIIELTDKKIDYINLKVLIEKIITKLKPNRAKVLILKYVNGLSIEQMEKVLNISNRSCYRTLNLALEDFAVNMLKFGYTSEKMEILFSNDEFLSSIYKSITTERSYKCDDLDTVGFNALRYVNFATRKII